MTGESPNLDERMREIQEDLAKDLIDHGPSTQLDNARRFYDPREGGRRVDSGDSPLDFVEAYETMRQDEGIIPHGKAEPNGLMDLNEEKRGQYL